MLQMPYPACPNILMYAYYWIVHCHNIIFFFQSTLYAVAVYIIHTELLLP